jgi:hypothetical protein
MPKINIDLGDQLKLADECYVVLKMIKKIPEVIVKPEIIPETKEKKEYTLEDLKKDQKLPNRKKQWGKTNVICEECLDVTTKANQWRHLKTKKHTQMSAINSKLYKPRQRKAKIIELKKWYNLK